MSDSSSTETAVAHKPATIWLMVNGLCDQLTDAVGAARIPFYLAMGWAFLWAVALYVNQWGYTSELVDRYQRMQLDSNNLRHQYIQKNPSPAASAVGAPNSSASDSQSSAANRAAPASTAGRSSVGQVSAIATPWTEPVDIPAMNIKERAFIEQCECYLAKDVAEDELGAPDKLQCPQGIRSSRSPQVNLPRQSQPRLMQVCFSRLDARLARYEATQHENRFIQFPGLPLKLHYSELGNVGQAGTLLLLAWMYYAFRRENHAIRQFVDFEMRLKISAMSRPGRLRYILTLKTYTLRPQNSLFKPESLAFSYGAIAQRFLLILTREGQPLRFATILLLVFPLFVDAVNISTDLHDDLNHIPLFSKEAGQIKTYDVVEILLFIWLVFATIGIVTELMESSVLLNGWYVASKDVWRPAWDERSQALACDAAINVVEQSAVPVSVVPMPVITPFRRCKRSTFFKLPSQR